MNAKIPVIRIAAVIITNPFHQILLVRKKGSTYFMQAGGKIEPAESALEAAIRELQEELILTVKPNQLRYLGQHTAPAANEPNHNVIADLFYMTTEQYPITAAAEIEEVQWVTIADAKKLKLAPLTLNTIIPIIENNICCSSE
ncbi:NUDIX domain-containing protein [Utexia brackfieldae]|uniref:NUDIX hydrolase n=1 Tax=Utexia brackfieldae TaxID=3074108 RepID=UPI00370DBCFC